MENGAGRPAPGGADLVFASYPSRHFKYLQVLNEFDMMRLKFQPIRPLQEGGNAL